MNNEHNNTEPETNEIITEVDQIVTEPEAPVASDSSATPKKEADDDFGIFDLVRMVISATCLMLILLSFLFRASVVDGGSMDFTLADRDMLIISNRFYTPQQSDIVIFEHENYSSPLVKRIIATENQIVDIDGNGQVYVDGIAISEPYANVIGKYDSSHTKISFPYTIPEGHVFVLGDNRNKSEDSRWFGAINEQQILGRVLFRLFRGFGRVD